MELFFSYEWKNLAVLYCLGAATDKMERIPSKTVYLGHTCV